MTRKVREIQDLVIDEISLVDKGANQHATVTIAKSADGEKENYMDVYDELGNPLDPDALDIGDVVFDADGDAYEIQADNDDDEGDFGQYEDQFDLEEVGKSSSGRAVRTVGRIAGSRGHPTPRSNVSIGASNAMRSGREALSSGRSAASSRASSVGSRLSQEAGRFRAKALSAGSSMGPHLPSPPSTGSAAASFTARNAHRAGTAAGTAAGHTANWASRNSKALGYTGAGLGIGGASFAGAEASNRRVRKSYGASELREELSKALTDRDRDDVISKAFGQIEELSKAAEAAQWAAEEERDIRLTNEYIEIAKSYELPTVEVDELAMALKNMAENLSYEDCEVIGKALQFAAEANDALYYEVGSIGGGDNSDVLQMVNAHVDGYVAKNYGVSREELTSEVFASNPEAYDQYLAEQRG